MENVISVKRRLWTFTIRKRYKPPQFYKTRYSIPKGNLKYFWHGFGKKTNEH